jgi:hypothetical protein
LVHAGEGILGFHTDLKKKMQSARSAELSYPGGLSGHKEPDNEWRSGGTPES